MRKDKKFKSVMDKFNDIDLKHRIVNESGIKLKLVSDDYSESIDDVIEMLEKYDFGIDYKELFESTIKLYKDNLDTEVDDIKELVKKQFMNILLMLKNSESEKQDNYDDDLEFFEFEGVR